MQLRARAFDVAYTLYSAFQSALLRLGLYVGVARRSRRSDPVLVNRMNWRPFASDDEWRSLYKVAQSATNGDSTDNFYRQLRFYSTFQLVAYTAKLPAGDVVECGCWHGHSTVAIATILKAHKFSGEFHVFDSFEGGLSDFGPEDESLFRLSEAEKKSQVETFRSSYDLVKAHTDEFGFVQLHRGWIPESFGEFSPRPIRFAHIDVDMYEPTKAALELFWESLVPGGCLVVDDYNSGVFEGATRAVDEFLHGKNPQLVYKVPLGSIFILK